MASTDETPLLNTKMLGLKLPNASLLGPIGRTPPPQMTRPAATHMLMIALKGSEHEPNPELRFKPAPQSTHTLLALGSYCCLTPSLYVGAQF